MLNHPEFRDFDRNEAKLLGGGGIPENIFVKSFIFQFR